MCKFISAFYVKMLATKLKIGSMLTDIKFSAGIFGMVWRRFSSQLLQVKVVAQSVLGLVQPSSSSSSKNSLVRDSFGLHKMIVAVTSAGKIFGIDNLSGEVIWQIQTPQLAPLRSGKSPVLPLYVLRTTSHVPHAPHCAILGKDKVGSC
jgi:ER membrane protein complex subunit 1